jgi:inorganic triphosphatase YgiF
MDEIELKLDIAPEEHARFRKLEALSGSAPTRTRLTALYFDTPTHDLRKHEMAIRLRRSGQSWKQSLKAGASGAGGLHSRGEWEFDRPDPSIDLALFAPTPLARMPRAKKLHRSLAEIFRVEVVRTTWEVEVSPGTRVEVVLDRGVVTHGQSRETISEVEIESLEGSTLAVFDVAALMVDRVPLRLSGVTKAERGYRLASGEKLAPVKASPVELEGALPALAAARRSISSALTQLQGNEAGVLETNEPEFVHQMRVALRRLRSALRAFRSATGAELEAGVRDDLRWITRATGNARDLDVLATRTIPPMLEAYAQDDAAAFKRRLGRRRSAARNEVRAALRSERYAKLVLALSRWLAESAHETGASQQSAKELAVHALRKRHGKLMRAAQGVEAMSPEERHRVRIGVKRLRYVAEGFASLLRKGRVDAYLESLEKLQDDLGRANDAAVAERLLEALAAPAPLAAFARGWLARESGASVEGLRRDFQRVARARVPWEAA